MGPPSRTVAGQRFPGRCAAGEVVELTRNYRAALRRYDPNSLHNDPLMYEVVEGPPQAAGESADEYARYSASYHDTAGVLPEALSELGYREAETAETEAYLALAEVIDNYDDFCLTLVWSLMGELGVHLSADEQRAVVGMAAGLFRPTSALNPVDAALQHLEAVSSIEGYSVRPIPDAGAAETAGSDARTGARISGDDSSRTRKLTFGDYVLAERTDRVSTLPLAVALTRWMPGQTVRFLDGETLSDGRWQSRLRMSPKNGAGHASGSAGLVSVEVTEDRWLNSPNASLGW